jgi:hypothetical protein
VLEGAGVVVESFSISVSGLELESVPELAVEVEVDSAVVPDNQGVVGVES